MKYTQIGIFTLILIAPLTSYASFDTNLKYGSRGEPVKELQEFLTDQGFYNAGVTGNFYSLTLAGVKKFQAFHNLPTTGYFGSMSRAVANQILSEAIAETEVAEIQEVGATTTPLAIPDDLTKKINDLSVKIEEQKTTLGSIIQNTQPVMPPAPQAPVPQTFSIESLYQTGPNFPEGGDRFPSVKITSNKPFLIDRITLSTSDQFEGVFFNGGSIGSVEKMGAPVGGIVVADFPVVKRYNSATVRVSFFGQGVYGGGIVVRTISEDGTVSEHEVSVTSK